MENTNSMDGQGAKSASPIEFSGSGNEYFKIWIVNILLTIVTFGIYSAWAKVRTNQYFYSNTKLADGVFNYHAKPFAILMGRIIAVVFLIAYGVLGNISPLLAGLMLLILVLATPWIVVRSLMFQARNTSFRNVRFDFHPAYGEAAMIFLVWPILIVISLGLLTPVYWHRQISLLTNNMRFGTSAFKFNQNDAGPFFGIYFRMLGFILLFGVVVYAVLALIPGAIMFNIVSTIINNPFYLIGAQVVGVLLYLGALLLINSYVVAKVTNLMYSKLSLDGHSFNSTLTTGGFFGQYFKHTIYTMLTLGLYVPWAKVNIIKYRLNNLTVNIAGDLDTFIAKKVEQGGAAAEGLGDMFEVEMGF